MQRFSPDRWSMFRLNFTAYVTYTADGATLAIYGLDNPELAVSVDLYRHQRRRHEAGGDLHIIP